MAREPGLVWRQPNNILFAHKLFFEVYKPKVVFDEAKLLGQKGFLCLVLDNLESLTHNSNKEVHKDHKDNKRG